MRSKSILSGVNVPITPMSNADTKLTNNITISNVTYPGVTETLSNDTLTKDKEEEVNPYKSCQTSVNESHTKLREIENSTRGNAEYLSKGLASELESYLLKLYQSILLSKNKKLIANVIFRDSIILTQEDLEKVIEFKIGKKCVIEYQFEEIGCLGGNKVFMKINSIRINDDDDGVPSDFKIKYNKDYLELITTYHISLKYVLIN